MQLGTTMQNHLRSKDFLARWRMGDEFLVIMPVTSLDEASAAAERIRSAVEQESKEWAQPVTISAGLAVYPTHGQNLGELVDRAEAAIDKAKSDGKNRIQVAW